MFWSILVPPSLWPSCPSQHGPASKKNWIFINTTVRTFKYHKFYPAWLWICLEKYHNYLHLIKFQCLSVSLFNVQVSRVFITDGKSYTTYKEHSYFLIYCFITQAISVPQRTRRWYIYTSKHHWQNKTSPVRSCSFCDIWHSECSHKTTEYCSETVTS